MKNFKAFFQFTKQEQNGIFYLVVLLVLIQSFYWVIKTTNSEAEAGIVLDNRAQQQVDSLKTLALLPKAPKIYPFNPNFITDFKGYTLGMSTTEIDRLLEFRKTGKYVNSAADFQKVTQISDSLLQSISPYFKFPDWVLENQAGAVKAKTSARFKKKSEMIDLNQATAQELRQISGVGQKLSARIVKFRDRLGGFLVNEQLYEVYGLEPEVAERVLRKFQVIALPKIQKININTATWEELSQLVYITENTAKRIVAYRNENGPLDSLDELGLVKGFPKDKITRIGLYLSLSNDE